MSPRSTATCSASAMRHAPRSPVSRVTGTWWAGPSCTSSARRRAGTPIDSTGHHFCVAVADLDEAIAELDARGIEYQRAVQGEGVVQIWIADPAGNTIELQQDS